MDLNASVVYDKLISSGVESLYHANTVRTSCTFLREGKLLSRGTTTEQGLDQTSQSSDESDIRLGVWYDIFFDTRDIHDYCGRRNEYGPVLFEISADVLSQYWLPFVSITRSNPLYWDAPEEMSHEWQEKHFLTPKELRSKYNPLAHDSWKHMIVLRRAGGIVRLKPHLKEIVIDGTAPDWRFSKSEAGSALSMSLGALQNASRSSFDRGTRVRDKYDIRTCHESCECHDQYAEMSNPKRDKFFGP